PGRDQRLGVFTTEEALVTVEEVAVDRAEIDEADELDRVRHPDPTLEIQLEERIAATRTDADEVGVDDDAGRTAESFEDTAELGEVIGCGDQDLGTEEILRQTPNRADAAAVDPDLRRDDGGAGQQSEPG